MPQSESRISPTISICIPSYNRPRQLKELLENIIHNQIENIEIVISEDGSTLQQQIREVVDAICTTTTIKIIFSSNKTTLGYDANLRRCIELSSGEFCLLMGDDDLFAEDGLALIQSKLLDHPDSDVIIRSYATFMDDPSVQLESFRYLSREKRFNAGSDAVSFAFRRSVVISGLVIRRSLANKSATSKFDGTLLYQVYLISKIASFGQVLFIPEITVLYRLGGIPEFGNALIEGPKHSPKKQTPQSSLHFVSDLLRIAEDVSLGIEGLLPRLKSDLAAYSYPFLKIQRANGILTYIRYAMSLSCLGFGRYYLFWIYALALLPGNALPDKLIRLIKKTLGYTPSISK